MNPEERIRQLEQELQQAQEELAEAQISKGVLASDNLKLLAELQQAREELPDYFQSLVNKNLLLERQLSQWQECAREQARSIHAAHGLISSQWSNPTPNILAVREAANILRPALALFTKLTSTTTDKPEFIVERYVTTEDGKMRVERPGTPPTTTGEKEK